MESQQKQKVDTKCAIVCGGPVKDLHWLHENIINCNYIIAADSGYDYLKNMGINPNILIGDLDSVSSVPSGIEITKYPAKKDVTDFSACLEHCLKNGISDIAVYGAWGNRAGHSIAAVLTMLQYCKMGLNIRIMTEKSEMFIVLDKCTLPRNKGYVSIFPLDKTAEGVTLIGFEYPLTDFTLQCCSPLGVSNQITADVGEISVKSGSLLVIIENQ